MRRLSLLAGCFAAPAIALAGPPVPQSAAPNVPTVFTTALPAHVSFIASLPVAKSPDEVDLDLRVEVVLPAACGDQVAGLLSRGAPNASKPGAADYYEAVIVLHEVGECKKEATRIGARTAIRMKLPDRQTRELSIGALSMKVARAGDQVTIDGNPPEGDLPGAPPTARPGALVLGDVTAAKAISAARITGHPRTARADVTVTAKWVSCAGPPLGFLASGDAKTHFALTHFEPLARAPRDEPCKGTATRTTQIPAVFQLGKQQGKQLASQPGKTGDETAITIGKIDLLLSLPLSPAPPQANSKK